MGLQQKPVSTLLHDVVMRSSVRLFGYKKTWVCTSLAEQQLMGGRKKTEKTGHRGSGVMEKKTKEIKDRHTFAQAGALPLRMRCKSERSIVDAFEDTLQRCSSC